IKVIVSTTTSKAIQDPKILDVISDDMAMITGQRPAVTRARKSVAGFHLRKGAPIGLKVTLRGGRAYDFIDRLVNFALPRVRDFRGIPIDSFDGRGSYTFGVDEQLIFPEIEVDKVKTTFGMNITIVTSAKRDEEAFQLLSALGFPFERRA
ncbi:MAG: 50S ribosomal protein L5, partial [candidate division WOR-3 bacterium]